MVGVGVGVIAGMLDMLCMGYAAKQWEVGGGQFSSFDVGLSAQAQAVGALAVAQVSANMQMSLAIERISRI